MPATTFSFPIAAALLLAAYQAHAAATIHVNVTNTLNNVSRASLGINTLTWFDSDYHHDRSRPLAAAANEMNLGTLRGGDSQGVWSVPPYSNAMPTAARHGDGGSAQGNPEIYNPDGTYADNKLGFDELAVIAQNAGAQRCIVVASQTHRNPTNATWLIPRPQLIEAARECVRYANVTHGQNVRYWEIGNETSLNNGMGSGAGQTPAEYALDVRDFSTAMKTVDPTIWIGAGSDWNTNRMDTLLAPANRTNLDFIVSHTYNNYPAGYTDFLRWPADPIEIKSINKRIDALPLPDRDRIKIAVTEFGTTATFSDSETNDTWHALGTFELAGRILEQPRVQFALLWTAHWYHSDRFWANALTDEGNALTPIGRVMAMWGNALKTRMVRTTTTTNSVQAFASLDAANCPNIFLVNKALTNHDVTVVFDTPVPVAVGTRTQFRGTTPGDSDPIFTTEPPVTMSGSAFTLALPALSATVIAFVPGSTAATPAAPTTPVATAFSDRRIDLRWTDNALNETGFKLRWSTQPSADNGGFALPPLDASTWSITGLTAGTTYYVKVKATNRWGDSAYTVPLAVTTLAAGQTNYPPGTVWTSTVRIATASDDAEELSSGAITLDSSDIDLVFDTNNPERGNQTIGLRFPGLAVPRGATITNAFIQFTARMSEQAALPIAVTLHGQAADHAPTFTTNAFSISTRPRTTNAIAWTNPGAWESGHAGPHARSPDLRAVVQEIVNRPGWSNGNALALLVTGTGTRTAWSLDGGPPLSAPLLHVAWTTNAPPPVPDADGDGLPDAWELARFPAAGTNTNPNADLDADGADNRTEYIAGTDPTNRADRLWCDATLSNGTLWIGYTARAASGPGYAGLTRLYSLERASNEPAAPWLGVPGQTNIAGTDTYRNVSNAPGTAPTFFRVHTSLQ